MFDVWVVAVGGKELWKKPVPTFVFPTVEVGVPNNELDVAEPKMDPVEAGDVIFVENKELLGVAVPNNEPPVVVVAGFVLANNEPVFDVAKGELDAGLVIEPNEKPVGGVAVVVDAPPKIELVVVVVALVVCVPKGLFPNIAFTPLKTESNHNKRFIKYEINIKIKLLRIKIFK